MTTIFNAWGNSWRFLKKHPGILLPFIILAIFEGVLLTLFYLAPQRPFLDFLGPPIRFYFGEEALRYPNHLFYLFPLFDKANRILGALLGTLLSATAVGMIQDANNNQSPSMAKNFLTGLKRIFAVIFIGIINFTIMSLYDTYGNNLVLSIWPDRVGGPALLIFYLGILVQMIFVYYLPCIIINQRSMFGALTGSIHFLIKHLIPSLILFMTPTLIVIPLIIVATKIDRVMTIFQPEAVLVVLGTHILFTLFVNFFITSGTTLYFLEKRST